VLTISYPSHKEAICGILTICRHYVIATTARRLSRNNRINATMRIEKDKYPPLRKKLEWAINEDQIMTFGVCKDIFLSEHKNLHGSNRNIKFVADSFFKAFEVAFSKINHDELSSFLNKERNNSGILLFNQNGNHNSVCYVLDSRESEHTISLTFFQNELLTYSFVWRNGEHLYNFFDSNNFEPEGDVKYWIIALLWFIKYCDLEVKELPPSRQIFEGVNCVYNNKTDHTIQIIDSTWFTTLIKSDAFKVRGHFRLQPHGEGLSKRKLIWVNEFEKHGYTRIAKIEQHAQDQ
jgi:hypothetical protein